MCDYSLESVTTRGARVGQPLILTQFENSFTRAFSGSDDPRVAVCLRPGTELNSNEMSSATASFSRRNCTRTSRAFDASILMIHINITTRWNSRAGNRTADALVPRTMRTVLQFPAAETPSNTEPVAPTGVQLQRCIAIEPTRDADGVQRAAGSSCGRACSPNFL